MNASRIDVVRAWKDLDYREGLSEAERAALPANPAGLVELADAELAGAAGGVAIGHVNTWNCSSGILTDTCCQPSTFRACGLSLAC